MSVRSPAESANMTAHGRCQALSTAVMHCSKSSMLARGLTDGHSTADFMKLRVTVDAIELSTAVVVLAHPAARANAKYAHTLKAADRQANFIPDGVVSVDQATIRKATEVCKHLLENPEELSDADGKLVKVPPHQQVKVQQARLALLLSLLDVLLAQAERAERGKEEPVAGWADAVLLSKQRAHVAAELEAVAAGT